MKDKRITVLGTRGIPNVLGGVETHCQNLYPEIKDQSHSDITIIARSPYVEYDVAEYKGITTKSVWAPKKKSLEAIIHSTLASFKTLFDGSQVVHVHAIGPGLVVPLLRLFGKKVVFTHHGPDYDRQKWGKAAKRVLKLGEKWAVKYASEVVVISDVINSSIKKMYNRYDANLIYNGVLKPKELSPSVVDDAMSKFNLERKKYIVAVGRLVEEKGFHDLIEAYKQSGIEYPLVIAGDADHETEYSQKLKTMAKDTRGVVMTGFLTGDELQAVFSQARLYAMSSYHEGLPISLLEALSYSLPCVVSDIPANSEIGLESDIYYETGNVEQLSEKLRQRIDILDADYSTFLQRYDWKKIADQTIQVYKKCLTK
ncbi:glycosyltransferase family 4 protein [Vibrio hannami]|uniref:glycosyltransferase family 4 protein n=1 Tax=Vibrio hannami TaxID=2717094 RepID=UPI002410A63B|nr:glycosyltransferase family 4 protein [Vibrio hannami]MDG3087036.1 glycosyltransferase family 4 protein [Vibrio hannami]